MNKGTQHAVFKTETLGWKNDEKVKEIFSKVCQQIQPILVKHKWKVYTLLEFYPKDPALLGLNVGKGHQIKIRCRRPNNKNSFYNFNHIIGTMLHELAHIEVGNHGPKFQALWDQLWNELESYQKNGTDSIEGFNHLFKGCGQKLSEEKHNPVTVFEAKQKGAIAAEKRLKYQTLIGKGVERLGGFQNKRLTPKQLAVQAALLRFQ